LFALTVVAQTYRGAVRGTISDPNGQALPGATVTITNTTTGESRTATTGDQGEYAISALPPGLYEILIEKQPFEKYANKVELHVNEVVRTDVTLMVGSVGTFVIETFEGNLKQDSASLGTVVDNRQITGLPLDGRNFYELSLLVQYAAISLLASTARVKTQTTSCSTASTTSIRNSTRSACVRQ